MKDHPMSTDEPTGKPPPPQPDPQTTPDAETAAGDSSSQPEAAWQRRRCLDAIFGETLPSQTSDDTDTQAPNRGQDSNDAWLRAQVPPHHGSR